VALGSCHDWPNERHDVLKSWCDLVARGNQGSIPGTNLRISAPKCSQEFLGANRSRAEIKHNQSLKFLTHTPGLSQFIASALLPEKRKEKRLECFSWRCACSKTTKWWKVEGKRAWGRPCLLLTIGRRGDIIISPCSWGISGLLISQFLMSRFDPRNSTTIIVICLPTLVPYTSFDNSLISLSR